MTKFLTLLAAIGLLATPAFAEMKKEETAAIKCAEGDKVCEEKLAKEAKKEIAKEKEMAPAAGKTEGKIEDKKDEKKY